MLEWFGWIVASWLLADLISGVVHWWEDRYVSASTPLIGSWVGAPNELHHVHQGAFLVGGYWHRNWSTIVPAMVCCALCLCFEATRWFALAFAFASQGNELHAWAHQRGKVSAWVAVLQASGVLLSPRQHAEHHRGDHDRAYCSMTGILNPILDSLGVWSRMERCLAFVGVRGKG